MKKIWIIGLLFASIILISGCEKEEIVEEYPYVKGDVVVGFEKNVSLEEAEAILSKYNLSYIKTKNVNLGKIFFYETEEKFIIKVPEGKEDYWMDVLNKEEKVYGAYPHPDPAKALVD